MYDRKFKPKLFNKKMNYIYLDMGIAVDKTPRQFKVEISAAKRNYMISSNSGVKHKLVKYQVIRQKNDV